LHRHHGRGGRLGRWHVVGGELDVTVRDEDGVDEGLHRVWDDGADWYADFGHRGGGQPHPGADGEDGADGALAPAEVLDAARDLLSREHGGRGRGGARRRRGGVEGDGGAARAHELHRPERVHHRRLPSRGTQQAPMIRNPID